jgi:hypothetical protein
MAKIILKKIGRSKISKTIIIKEKLGIVELETIAYGEVRKYLLSSDVCLIEKEHFTTKYSVIAGFYHVGDVEIIL